MLWILCARGISVLSILFQLRVFATLLNAEETSQIYFGLAVLGGYSLVSSALPNYLAVQSAYDVIENRIKIYKNITLFLFLGGGVSMLVNSLFFFKGIINVPISMLFAISFLVFLSNIPTLIANHFFAQNFLKQGALSMAVNVLFSQCVAILFILKNPTASTWFLGLCVGHLIASALAFFLFEKCQKDFIVLNVIATPKISKKIVFSVLFALSFGWLVPNLPRILLQGFDEKTQVAEVFLLGALTYSVVNTVELLILQTRRSVWVKFNLGVRSFRQLNQDILIERIIVLGIFMFSALTYFFVKEQLFRLVTGKKLGLSSILVSAIVTYEFVRGTASTLYGLAESTRTQFSSSLVLCFGSLVAVTAFYLGSEISIECAYQISASVLMAVLCTCFLLKKSSNFELRTTK